MTAFYDTSAVVRLFVDEEHHEVIRSLGGTVVTAHVTGVELCSALWRKVRAGSLQPEHATRLLDAFEADVDDPDGRFVRLPVDPDVLATASEVVRRHGLRAYDALQLGSAMVARGDVPDLVSFVAFDRELRTAAAAEGFAVAPDLT